MNLANMANQSRQLFSEFWAIRNARERTIITVAALIALSGLIYALLIDPALAGRAQLNKTLPTLRQQVAQMQSLSKEAAALTEKPTVPIVAMSKENIEAALVRNGLKPQNVMLTGDYAKVQLNTVSFASTLNWLDGVQKTALLSVIDANITVLDRPDMVNAAFTLRQPKND